MNKLYIKTIFGVIRYSSVRFSCDHAYELQLIWHEIGAGRRWSHIMDFSSHINRQQPDVHTHSLTVLKYPSKENPSDLVGPDYFSLVHSTDLCLERVSVSL